MAELKTKADLKTRADFKTKADLKTRADLASGWAYTALPEAPWPNYRNFQSLPMSADQGIGARPSPPFDGQAPSFRAARFPAS